MFKVHERIQRQSNNRVTSKYKVDILRNWSLRVVRKIPVGRFAGRRVRTLPQPWMSILPDLDSIHVFNFFSAIFRNLGWLFASRFAKLCNTFSSTNSNVSTAIFKFFSHRIFNPLIIVFMLVTFQYHNFNIVVRRGSSTRYWPTAGRRWVDVRVHAFASTLLYAKKDTRLSKLCECDWYSV